MQQRFQDVGDARNMEWVRRGKAQAMGGNIPREIMWPAAGKVISALATRYLTTRFLDLKIHNLVFYLLGLGLDLIPPILSIFPFFPSTISMLMVYSLILYLGSQHLFYFF